MEESSLYTDASNRCFPEDFKSCFPRRVLKRPVLERKSGTVCGWIRTCQLVGAKVLLTSSRRRNAGASNNHNLLLVAQGIHQLLELRFLLLVKRFVAAIVQGP